jgi:hypothetical protein
VRRVRLKAGESWRSVTERGAAQALQRGGLCGRANLARPRWRCSSVRCPQPEEIAVSESRQDQPDEQAPKPGEEDTETVAGQPKKAPESADGEQQSKQDQ